MRLSQLSLASQANDAFDAYFDRETCGRIGIQHQLGARIQLVPAEPSMDEFELFAIAKATLLFRQGYSAVLAASSPVCIEDPWIR